MDNQHSQWFSGPSTYHFNATNMALLPNQAPLSRPSLYQSYTSPSETTSGVVQDNWTDIPIRVVNPKQNRDVKTYILKNVSPRMIQTLKDLREEILEQLGKDVVNFSLKFDVGYMSGGHRICFKEKDIISLLPGIVKDGGPLWCEGVIPPSNVSSQKR